MSQPDLLRELRESRPVAPAELRERVRLIAAQASETPPPRRFFPRPTRRRALLVLVPVALAASIAAVVVLPRGGQQEDLGSLDKAYRAAPSSEPAPTGRARSARSTSSSTSGRSPGSLPAAASGPRRS